MKATKFPTFSFRTNVTHATNCPDEKHIRIARFLTLDFDRIQPPFLGTFNKCDRRNSLYRHREDKIIYLLPTPPLVHASNFRSSLRFQLFNLTLWKKKKKTCKTQRCFTHVPIVWPLVSFTFILFCLSSHLLLVCYLPPRPLSSVIPNIIR